MAAVKRAYLREIKIWHPDRYSQDSMLRGNAEERSKALTAAYAALSLALKTSAQEGITPEPAVAQQQATPRPDTRESAPPTEEWFVRVWRRLKAQLNEGPASPKPATAATPPHKQGATRQTVRRSPQPCFDDVLEAARNHPQTPADISLSWRRLAARRARYGRRRGSGSATIEPIKSRGPVPPVDRIHPIGEDN